MRVGLNLNNKQCCINLKNGNNILNNINRAMQTDSFVVQNKSQISFKGNDEFIRSNCPSENYIQLDDVKKLLPKVRQTAQELLLKAENTNIDGKSELILDSSNNEKSEKEYWRFYPNGNLQSYLCKFVSKKKSYNETEEFKFNDDGTLREFSLEQSQRGAIFDEKFFTFDMLGAQTRSTHREITKEGTLEYITKVDFDKNDNSRCVETERKIYPSK